MKENFEACLAATLKWEGGYSNHPHDPGGRTMRGVTQRVFTAWLAKHGRPWQHVRYISDADLREIYRANYWDACGCGDLEPGLDLAVFDYAVNSGPGRARPALTAERAAQAKRGRGNGHHTASLIVHYSWRRLQFLRGLVSLWRVFGAGWTNRVLDITATAVDMAEQSDAQHTALQRSGEEKEKAQSGAD